MRTTVAVALAVVILFVGIIGANSAAESTEDPAVTNGTNTSGDAWNFTTGIADGVGQAFGPGVVWMGVAAIVLGSLGVLLAAGRSGR